MFERFHRSEDETIRVICNRKDDKVKKKTKDRSLKNETCQKKQVDTKKEDHECLDSYVNEEKCQEDYSRKKKRKMKQAR
ncbi:uncharacterized protein LOC143216486 isoform X3 [Lasioglossum baleicum]|uniref:uncharacterized protein LOC143216486 isoform X3 n=1 Tax=Lasioglossum baleicum TaxID=434251 RepID=UPI003FCD5D90